jgi:hypothetical protein
MKESQVKNNSTKCFNTSTILLSRHINYVSHFNNSLNYNQVFNEFNSRRRVINFESKRFNTLT